MSSKTFVRMLAELNALDEGGLDVDQMAAQFGVKPGTIVTDFFLLRKFGLTDVLPVAESGACELCSRQGERVTHHWTDQYGLQTKSTCRSCNARLGRIFKGSYPSWEEQVKALSSAASV